jgi:hypothetical protein
MPENVDFYTGKIKIYQQLLRRYYHNVDIFYIPTDDFDQQDDEQNNQITAYYHAQNKINALKTTTQEKVYRFCFLKHPEDHSLVDTLSSITKAQEKNAVFISELHRWLYSQDQERRTVGEEIHLAQQKFLSNVQELVVHLAFEKKSVTEKNFTEKLNAYGDEFKREYTHALKKFRRQDRLHWGLGFAFAGAVLAAVAIVVSCVILPMVCPAALTMEPIHFIMSLAQGSPAEVGMKIFNSLLTSALVTGALGAGIGFWKGSASSLHRQGNAFKKATEAMGVPKPHPKHDESKVQIRDQIGGGGSPTAIPRHFPNRTPIDISDSLKGFNG